MLKVTVIGEKEDLAKHKSALKFSEFDVKFVDKDKIKTANFEDDLALIVLPWQGYREAFANPGFNKHIEQHSVIVAGPAIYFFEIEEWVIDGSICFLSSPLNSMKIESVLNEILRIRGGHAVEAGRSYGALKNSA